MFFLSWKKQLRGRFFEISVSIWGVFLEPGGHQKRGIKFQIGTFFLKRVLELAGGVWGSILSGFWETFGNISSQFAPTLEQNASL